MTPAFGFDEVRLYIMPIVSGYFNAILSRKTKSSCQQQLRAGATLHCGTTMDWIGTIPRSAPAGRIRMSAMAETKARVARPLSPHLQIYRPMLTMMMSIAHRITGFGLYFGTLILAWWFISAVGPNGYARFEWFAGSWIGRLILFGYTWALIHHMLGGIRHLIWDTGRGLGPTEREWLAAANLIGSITITVILWIIGLLAMGGSP